MSAPRFSRSLVVFVPRGRIDPNEPGHSFARVPFAERARRLGGRAIVDMEVKR